MVIPDGVTIIGDAVFKGCTILTNIILPNSVLQIGDQAFSQCSRLSSISIPNNVTSIGFQTFYFCNGLTNITMPESLTIIEDQAFYLCSGLKSIAFGTNLRHIGTGAFQECRGLGNIVIPNSTTNIGGYAFSGCSGLTNVTLPNNISTLEDKLFYTCTGLTNITIPDSVTCISNSAFYYCVGLNSISIPKGVISIGSSAFYCCFAATSVSLPDSLIRIGGNAFGLCNKLNNITIPYSVTNIGPAAFVSCPKLVAINVDAQNSYYCSVDGVLFDKSQSTLVQYPGGKAGSYVVPAGVTSISDLAFNGCVNLTSVSISLGVTNIGSSVFVKCASLSAINLDELNPIYSSAEGVLFNKNKTVLIQCPGAKSDSYTIPGSVTQIGDNAFSQCSILTKVTIPAGVTSIGGGAFSYCSSLTVLLFQGNAPGFGASVFDHDSKATGFILPESTGWTSTAGGRPTALWNAMLPYAYTTNINTITITAYAGSDGTVSIPGTITGWPVTSISNNVFYRCSTLTNIILPEGIITIRDNSFFNCPNLTQVTIPNSVTSIGKGTFASCTGLTSLTLGSSITNIDRGSFGQCANLKTIYCLGNAPKLGYMAFADFSLIMGGHAYYLAGSTGWTSKLGDYYTALWDPQTQYAYNINNGAISFVAYLGTDKNVTIPSNINGLPVTSLAEYAFYNFPNLVSVTIPSTVTGMGYQVFNHCTNLNSIYFLGNRPNVSSLSAGSQTVSYYLPGTKGWGATFGNLPTAVWKPKVLSGTDGFGVQSNHFGFDISWASGKVVLVEACTNLVTPDWIPVGTNAIADGTSYFSDPGLTNHPVRFYRLRSQ
jgi:hypothetical protein